MDPFRSADAEQHGYTAHQVRVLPHPTHGVVAPVSTTELRERCRAVLVGLPGDSVFTHLTAARLYGWWLPRIDDEPLIACTDSEAPHHDRRGVYVRRCGIPVHHRREVEGLPVSSPEWTIAELAEDLTFLDLVVVIDSALHAGDTTIERLRAVEIRGRRGVRTLRRANAAADGRSESPWETVLRLLHVVAGIPVDVQVEKRDPRTGAPIWRLDLLIRGTRRAPEFDGSDHTRPEVRQRDLRRDKMLVRDGIVRFAYTASDVSNGAAGIVRDGEDALGLDHDPTRLKLWWPIWESSTFSRPGYGRLMRRLRRFRRDESPRRVTRSPSGAKADPSGAILR